MDLINCSKANLEFRGTPGEFAYLRELLLRLILMSVFDGELSSREIERKTRTDISYMYLAAMENPEKVLKKLNELEEKVNESPKDVIGINDFDARLMLNKKGK